ncbi:ABC transporter ATP-binding protein [Rhizobium aegyptiacum]|uniref:ABC transporter ATP-binding protein n=1 Tax=Rhizobium aegyptiacum TaxID=1764550 RepID=UPI000AB049FA|nr:ABC transporter ATP-binding protein [Rhizobium aegyptiacum]
MLLALMPLRPILGEYLRASKLSLAAIILAIAIGSTLSVFAPYFFSRQLDDLRPAGSELRWATAFGIYAVSLGLLVIFQRGTQYLAVIQSERLSYFLSRQFFARLIRKTPDFFIKYNPTEIQSAQAQGSQSVAALVQIAFSALLPGLGTFILTLALLGSVIDAEIILIVCIYGVVFLTLVMLANRICRPFMERAINTAQENARFVGNALFMIEPLRYSGSSAWMKDQFARSAETVFSNWRAYALRRIVFVCTIGVATAVQFAVTFYLLLPRYQEGALSVGDLVLFNTLLFQLNIPFELLGQSIDETIRALVRMNPIAKMWAEAEVGNIVDTGTDAVSAHNGVVQVENVSYQYDNGRGANRISFSAEKGRVTFITGESGSGKSTLFKMLLKAIEPQTGQILVDGKSLASISRETWFGQIGVVPQEVAMLNDTVRSNIVLGRIFDETRLIKATRRAAIYDRILEFPEGFDTRMGERGMKLSGGEKQRIAIARAIYSEPALLLLDEASSALDEQTEAEIMQQLRNIGDDMTIIAITHRHSTIQARDAVVELQK